jgi:hypothetical protein
MARIERSPWVTSTQRVRPEQHLAPPEEAHLMLCDARGDPVGDAGAAPAAVKPEHEARPVGRAAVDARPKAETAVPGVRGRDHPLVELEHRVPDQRAVGEHPDVGLAVRRGERFVQRCLELFFGQELTRKRRTLERAAERVVQQVRAAELALLRRSGAFADERLAALDRAIVTRR